MAVSLSLEKAIDPDLARALIAQLRQSPHTVAGVMTPEPVTIGPKEFRRQSSELPRWR